jgi:hypothetical protein
MNNLLFTALCLALLYYFFYYLPRKKNLSDPPLTNLTYSQFTQTDPDPSFSNLEAELHLERAQRKEQELDYQQKIKNQQTEITQLQTQLRELVKRPLKPTNSKGIQTEDKELTNTLDTLIKDIQDLNKELDHA